MRRRIADVMKFKFLTVIWGARYIDEFARLSLPSYLAPGNLPYVASEAELEIVILTSREGQSHFAALPIMEKLNRVCPVRFILIDDLITTGVYGVTLTLAYARGIQDSGDEQTNTHFLFMNSDFVLADGSLRSTIAKLREGYPCVMAPSLRASAEPTLPKLALALSSDGQVLNMSSREMVKLAFDNLHPTVIAKTVTQDFMTCQTHNQLFWQVDGTTLLARYHLIFMLAIKPEVPIRNINSYCDYGFVPELVPSGKFGILDDSDDFFMLELQPAMQEQELLSCGTKSLNGIAAELSRWTTREHRRFALKDIVFRTSSPANELPEARAAAERFVEKLHARMKVSKDHIDHHYWVAGVQAWISLKFGLRRPVLPPELAEVEPNRSYRWYSRFLGKMQRHSRAIPNVPIWSWLWPDSRMLLDWIDQVRSGPPSRVLLLCSKESPLQDHLPKHFPIGVQIVGPKENIGGLEVVSHKRESALRQYDQVLIHIYRADILDLRRQIALADQCVGHEGTISIFIEHKNSDYDDSNFSHELSQYANRILPLDWLGYKLEARFVGGPTKRRLRQIERLIYRLIWPASMKRFPLMFVGAGAWIGIAGLIALNNLWTHHASSVCPDYCTSALLALSKRKPVPSRARSLISQHDRPAVEHLLPGE
jgi:hypothetical protein